MHEINNFGRDPAGDLFIVSSAAQQNTTDWKVETTELYFSQFWGWKSKSKALVDLVSPGAFLRGWQLAIFLLCLHMTFSLCINIPGTFSSSYKAKNQIGLEPTHMTSFNLHYL